MLDSMRIVDVKEIKSDRELKAEKMMFPDEVYDATTPKGRVRRFVALEKERRELEGRLKLVKDEASTLAEQIGTEFEESGTQRERVDGLTVFLNYQTWARPKDGDMQRLVEALNVCGMGDMTHATVNLQTLSAVVREKMKEAAENNIPDDKILPTPVLDALHITSSRQLKSITGQTPRNKE